MENSERLQMLADVAATLTNLPVDEQFRRLAQAGLTLRDTNWKNWKTNPEQETVIPIQPRYTEQPT